MHCPHTPSLSGARPPALGQVGTGLVRPECVLATRRGELYTADWRGGVARRDASGRQSLIRAAPVDGVEMKPNGIALLPDGAFLLAHLGVDAGGVYRLERSGEARPWLMRVDGLDLPPTNFVVQQRADDGAMRTWITVSTRQKPRALGYRKSCDDGFIVLADASGARIVADGLGYTNEVAVHPDGRWLYVNETFGRRLSRFGLHADGSLGPRETVAEFGAGSFPDGLAFDVEGNAWVVSIVSNRLLRVAPDGRQTLWLEDVEAEHLAWVEQAYLDDAMGRPHLDGVKSRVLRNVSSIAFSGPDLRTGVLGCLLGENLVTLQMPVAGHPPVHWHYPSP